jgi:hypothetical protein
MRHSTVPAATIARSQPCHHERVPAAVHVPLRRDAPPREYNCECQCFPDTRYCTHCAPMTLVSIQFLHLKHLVSFTPHRGRSSLSLHGPQSAPRRATPDADTCLHIASTEKGGGHCPPERHKAAAGAPRDPSWWNPCHAHETPVQLAQSLSLNLPIVEHPTWFRRRGRRLNR